MWVFYGLKLRKANCEKEKLSFYAVTRSLKNSAVNVFTAEYNSLVAINEQPTLLNLMWLVFIEYLLCEIPRAS